MCARETFPPLSTLYAEWSSYKLLGEFTHLHKKFWGRRMWARSYFVCSSGNVTDEVIAAYIEHQSEMPGTEDGFRVEGQDAEQPSSERPDATGPRVARQEADRQSAPPKLPAFRRE